MEKVDVAYVYNGIFFSHKKEGNPAICNNMLHPCCNMDGYWGHYAKWDVREKRQIFMISPTCESKTVKLIETNHHF